jgi:hypothetical protein
MNDTVTFILYDPMVLDPVPIAPWPSSTAGAVLQDIAEQSRTRATPGTFPSSNAIESCRRSGRSVRSACPYGPGIDCTRRASKRRCHFGCLASFPSSRPHNASVLPGRSSTPSASCDGGFRIAPFGEDSSMTALQIFFNSLRSRTIVRAIWMPVLIGILLIGACIPSKRATAPPVKPQQTMHCSGKPSSRAIIRQRARGAGKTRPQASFRP